MPSVMPKGVEHHHLWAMTHYTIGGVYALRDAGKALSTTPLTSGNRLVVNQEEVPSVDAERR